MAILHSGAGKYREINDDDYRAYLITRNQEPIVYHSQDMQFRRLQVHVRSALDRIDRFLHCLREAIVKTKHRKLQRELMMRGDRQHCAPHDRQRP
ncbi:hypothetical protein V1291_000759 [Nitrobacteraceae bacterium AZCC 1564]